MSGLALQRTPTTLGIQSRWLFSDHVGAAAWRPQSGELALALAAGGVCLLDLAAGTRRDIAALSAGAVDVAWSPDARMLASAGQDGCLRVIDVPAGTPVLEHCFAAPWVDALAWSARGDYLAAAAGKEVRIWTRQGRLQREYADHAGSVSALQWHPRDPILASASYRGVRLFDAAKPGRPATLLSCPGALVSLAWSPLGSALAAGGQDRLLNYWDVERRPARHLAMRGYPSKVSHLAWAGDGQWLASTGGSSAVIWSTAGKGPEGSRPVQLKGHSARVSALAFRRHGHVLATGCAAGGVGLWSLAAREVVPLWRGQLDSEVTTLAFSADDGLLAVGTHGGEVLVVGSVE